MEKMRIGVMGCGEICNIYITNLQNHFNNVEVISCSDLYMDKAEATKEKYGLKRAYTNEDMLADPEVDIVLNLTIPAVHYQLNMAILNAGKHVYCEKPLALNNEETADILRLAKEKNLRVSDAPDTFLGPGIQTVRKLIDDGAIGDLIGFTANFCTPGHEHWHPSPMFYYQPGGGPMRDMGPYFLTALVSILGPVDEVFCYTKTGFPTRPVKGQMVTVPIPTHYAGVMKMKNGVFGNINMSFDTWYTQLPHLEIYGTKGMITVPHPNGTGGPVKLFKGVEYGEDMDSRPDYMDRLGMLYGPGKLKYYEEQPLIYKGSDNMRGVAAAEMAAAIAEGRPHLASGEMAAHIVDIQNCFEQASNEGRVVKLTTSFELPEPFYPYAEKLWVE